MGATTVHALPYPEASDQPQVHLDIKALAEATETTLGSRRQWHNPRTGNASDPYVVGGFQTMQLYTLTGLPAGDYLISFQLTVSATATGSGNVRVTAGGTILNNDGGADILAANLRHVFAGTFGYQHAGGDLEVATYHLISAGTGTVYSPGTSMTAAYLGRRG